MKFCRILRKLLVLAVCVIGMNGTSAYGADLTHEMRVQQQAQAVADSGWQEKRQDALRSWENLSLQDRIAATNTAQITDQIVLLVDHRLTLWNKEASGKWSMAEDLYAGHGRNGLSDDRYAGSKTTPVGSFPLQLAFGTHENPGTAMDYRRIKPTSYWSAATNYWTESDWDISGEHLSDYYQYEYAVAIGYNYDPVIPGRGSCIFMHVKSNSTWGTSGCISLEKPDMLRVMQELHNGAYIIIIRKDEELKKF